MNKRSCDTCLFSDLCPGKYPCKHHSPIDESDDDLIEAGRKQFYDEWDAYLEDAEASIF